MNEFELAADLICPPMRDDWDPLPHQIPPNDPRDDNPHYVPQKDWYVWLLMAGRGAGKTDASAYYVNRYAATHPNSRISIIAPTLGDARSACVNGPSGLLAHNPDIKVHKTPDYYLLWHNGSRADIFGAYTQDDVERLRAGGNRHLVWAEELAAWRRLQEAWDQMEFGLRLGSNPHAVASTTPKNRPLIRNLVKSPDVVVTRGHTDDNPHLHERTRERLTKKYGGTRLGRQELLGELIEDVDGALFSSDDIDKGRIDIWDLHEALGITEDPDVIQNILDPSTELANSEENTEPETLQTEDEPSPPDPFSPQDKTETEEPNKTIFHRRPNLLPDSDKPARSYTSGSFKRGKYLKIVHGGTRLTRVIVGVDPAVSSNPDSSYTGIVAVGMLDSRSPCPFHTEDPPRGVCAVVLEDNTMKGTPDAWGNAVLRTYDYVMADLIVGEVNNGGDLVESNVATAASNDDRDTPPFKKVRASRGKQIRAEPISALYEQGRIHHVGEFEELEQEMTTWEPDGREPSPDRMDALVWALADIGMTKGRSNSSLPKPALVGNRKSYWKEAS